MTKFDDWTYTHLPRAQNQFVDALITLASMIDIPEGVVVRPLLVETRDVSAYYYLIDDSMFGDGLPWYYDIDQFLRFSIYPEAMTTKHMRTLR